MTRTFFNQKASIWDETCCEQDVARLEAMAGRLGIEPGSTLLDVGSGTGIFLPFLLKNLGNQGVLVALDYAEEMLKKARGKDFSERIFYLLPVKPLAQGPESINHSRQAGVLAKQYQAESLLVDDFLIINQGAF